MKLSSIILEIIEPTPEYTRLVDKIKSDGGKFLGSGDYGSAYQVNNVVVKVTTDEVEIEHAELLKGIPTRNFAFIHDVEVMNPKLGIITMELLQVFNGDIPHDFEEAVKQEAQENNIDPEELDFGKGNVMIDLKTRQLKMIDV